MFLENISKSITITKIKRKFQQSQTLDFIVIREISPNNFQTMCVFGRRGGVGGDGHHNLTFT
jgi:hypothetical protein